MTERWKRSLEALDRLDPPGDLLEVAARGPRRMEDGRTARTSQALALMVGVVATALVIVLVGLMIDLRGPGTQTPRFTSGSALDGVPKIPQEGWAGVWPQVTRAAAEFAGTGPGAHESWQTDPMAVADAYVRDVFGWRSRIVEGGAANGTTQTFRVWPCADEDECRRATGVEVTVERLLRDDVLPRSASSSYWFVTDVRVAGDATDARDIESQAAADLLRSRASAVVSLFLMSRLDRDEPTEGSGAVYGTAERYLSAAAELAYEEHERGLYLYGAPDGHPRLRYRGFDMIQGPAAAANGTLRALIGILGVPAEGGPEEGFRESLVLEPVDGRILITGVAPA